MEHKSSAALPTNAPAGPVGTNRYSQLEVLLRYGFNVLLK
jgi:hypothetical protein